MTNTDIKRRLEELIKMIDERIENIDKLIDEDMCSVPMTTIGEQWGLSYAKGLIQGELRIIEIEEEE